MESLYLEFTKSAFLFKVKKHTEGRRKPYLELTQIDLNGKIPNRICQLNPKVLGELAQTLSKYDAFFKNAPLDKNDRNQRILNYYFKGLSVKNVATIFGLPQTVILKILEKNGCSQIQTKDAYQIPYKTRPPRKRR